MGGIVVVFRIAGRNVGGIAVSISDVGWCIENWDSILGKVVWYKSGERMEYINRGYRGDGDGDGDGGAKAGCEVRDG